MTPDRIHLGDSKIANRFDKAMDYDRSARVQAIAAIRLAGRLAGHYSTTIAPRRILELGCGTGLLTGHLRTLFPDAELTAIDLSPQMIARARRVVPTANYHVMDAERPALEGPFDLICSNFCLQWFGDRSKAFRRLSCLLSPGGRIEVTTLARGSFAQWRNACTALALPCGFPEYPDTETLQKDWPAPLHGKWDLETLPDPVGSAWQFLQDLKAIGATTPKEGSHCLSATQLRQIMQAFDETANSIDYQVAFGSACKARGVFVTGTDTGVGKTLVSALLLRALSATYWKPFQSGLSEEQGDAVRVAYLANLPASRLIAPAYELQAPLSPQAAARHEGVTITLRGLTVPDSNEPLVVEGAGGLMVPLDNETLLIDWMTTLNLPVILVCRSSLGTINHTLLSLEALKQRDIVVAGVVMSGPLAPGNRAAIEHYGGTTVLAEIPLLKSVTPDSLEVHASDLARTLRLLGF